MAATSTMRSATLQVPGGELYYEVRGSGPVLLMMPGGPADATTFRKLEDDLAGHYTVVTYDPRGISHSSPFATADDARMVQIFADDANRLLEATGEGKGRVFASSGGAVIALELALRHSDRLQAVVVHEPPSPDLLPDPERVRAAMADVCDTFAAEGLWPAMAKFISLVGIEGPPPPAGDHEPKPAELEAMAMMHKNLEFFFSRYIRNVARYRPDLPALKDRSCRIVPAVGSDSRGQLAHEGGVGLARILGSEPVVFPGDHGGFDGRPVEFAPRLREVLEA